MSIEKRDNAWKADVAIALSRAAHDHMQRRGLDCPHDIGLILLDALLPLLSDKGWQPIEKSDEFRRTPSGGLEVLQDGQWTSVPPVAANALLKSWQAGAEAMREACRQAIIDLARDEGRSNRSTTRVAALWDAYHALYPNKLPLPPLPLKEST